MSSSITQDLSPLYLDALFAFSPHAQMGVKDWFPYIFAYRIYYNDLLIFESSANVSTNEQQWVHIWETGRDCGLPGGTERVVGNMDHCFFQQSERELSILVNLKHYSPAELMSF